jgi:lysyl-tRNA synthetase, class II
LEKQKRLDAEKAEKAAKKAKEAEGKDKKVKEEEILDPTAYFENRSKMINDLKLNEKTYPYPHKFHVELTIHQFIEKFTPITEKSVWL